MYFAPDERHEPPYRIQTQVEAILDVAQDVSSTGVETIDPKMPRPFSVSENNNDSLGVEQMVRIEPERSDRQSA